MIGFVEADRLFRYDPSTGHIFWKVSRRGVRAAAGMRAGHMSKNGYVQIRTRGRRLLGHRLAWLLAHGHMPEAEIDHINGDPSDNRLCNLRSADRSQNGRNRRISSNSTTGFKGVTRRYGRFMACIRHNGKLIYLGDFDTPEEGHAAYVKAATERFGEFARSA